MIRFLQVSKRYASHTALNQVSFEVPAGEMVFLTGHSGAGKSTILRLILQLERATAGQILLNQQSACQLSRRHLPHLRRQLGFIGQDAQLLFDRTVFQNVALPLIIDGWRTKDLPGRVNAALDKVGLRSRAQCLPCELSCGEQQRVSIARAIVHKPPILLADEPTGNLDPELAASIMHLFASLNAVGITVLIATHALDLVAAMPFRVMTLRQGQIVGDH